MPSPKISLTFLPMKNPIKLALSLLALGCAVASPALRAQENKTPPPAGGGQGRGPGGRGMMTPEQRIEMLDKAVTLTAEQKTKIAAIYKDSAEKMKALAPEDGREKRMEMMKATQDAVRVTLTAVNFGHIPHAAESERSASDV